MEQAELNKVIEGVVKTVGFSGVVYIKERDEVIFQSAYGLAHRSERLSNAVHTRFGIASGCKLFTAIGICQLVETGDIRFDTKLNDCLNLEFPNFDKNITIHHLLTHTSGIPDYFDEEEMEDFEELWKDRPVYEMTSLHDFLPLFQNNAMKFSSGERFHYNNAGYILLGLIIEQQTGESFTDFIETEIFKKCGMRDSGYFSLDQLPENTALGYIDNSDDGTWRTNIYSVPVKGGADGGAFVTAPDMVRLWEALFNNELLKKETTAYLIKPQVNVDGDVDYGYGVWINKKNTEIFKYHVMGYDPGVSFHSAVYPEKGIKLAIPSNKEKGPFDVMKAIEKRL